MKKRGPKMPSPSELDLIVGDVENAHPSSGKPIGSVPTCGIPKKKAMLVGTIVVLIHV